MKKLFLSLSLIFSAQIYSMMDAKIWKGAPQAIQAATQDKEVLMALDGLGNSLQKLAALYAKKLAEKLTPEQKKQCAAMLVLLKKISIKAKALANEEDNSRLQNEVQELGQELFVASLPLIMMMQQEKGLVSKGHEFSQHGYNVATQSIDAMIKNLS